MLKIDLDFFKAPITCTKQRNLKRCQERTMSSTDIFLLSDIIARLLLKNKEVQSLPQVIVKPQKRAVVS